MKKHTARVMPKVHHGPELSVTVNITGHVMHNEGNSRVISHLAGAMFTKGHNVSDYIQN